VAAVSQSGHAAVLSCIAAQPSSGREVALPCAAPP